MRACLLANLIGPYWISRFALYFCPFICYLLLCCLLTMCPRRNFNISSCNNYSGSFISEKNYDQIPGKTNRANPLNEKLEEAEFRMKPLYV